jgi:hypothetical protein
VQDAQNWTPASGRRAVAACRYFGVQGMIGTTLIAFAGAPSMSFELTAR